MKTKSLLLSFVLLISISSLWASIPFPTIQGDGSQTNPYKIGTAAELVEARDSINLASVGSTKNAEYYQLISNIDMSGTEWVTPIGVAAKIFKGNFDGKGYKITGLFCGTSSVRNTTASNSLALFGQINGAKIKNLEVNVSFYVEKTGVTGNLYLGGLVNIITAGGVCYIDNCRVTGVLSQTNTNGATATTEKMGGIVAQNSSETYITNCSVDLQMSNTINLSGTATGCINGVGGIVGDSGIGVKSGIVNCYSTGSLTVFNSAGAVCGGGILGVRNGNNTFLCEILNCYSAMTINASQSNQTNTGVAGIAGSQNNTSPNTISRCIALNPSITYKSATTLPVGFFKRVAIKNAGASFSNNYAISSMIETGYTAWNFTTQTGTIATITPVNDVSGADGDVLTGSDLSAQIADGLSKLNAYVTTNPTYNSITLKTWVAGTTYPMFAADGVNSLIQNFALPTLNYILNGNVLKLNNIEGTKSLKINSVTGMEVVNAEVSSSYSVALRKGIYIVNLEGKTPTKVVVF